MQSPMTRARYEPIGLYVYMSICLYIEIHRHLDI